MLEASLYAAWAESGCLTTQQLLSLLAESWSRINKFCMACSYSPWLSTAVLAICYCSSLTNFVAQQVALHACQVTNRHAKSTCTPASSKQ